MIPFDPAYAERCPKCDIQAEWSYEWVDADDYRRDHIRVSCIRCRYSLTMEPADTKVAGMVASPPETPSPTHD